MGKTSLACATAIHLTASGKRVLLVSTDPASNVAQVFEQTIGHQITPIAAVNGLAALEVDPSAAAAAYRERIVGPVRGILPDDIVAGIEEQLSGACTTEIAAFDEFTALLTNQQLRDEYDHIVFDTAPTGIRYECCNCLARGAVISTTASTVRPVSDRWRAGKTAQPVSRRRRRTGECGTDADGAGCQSANRNAERSIAYL